jgi:hypothetical protein
MELNAMIIWSGFGLLTLLFGGLGIVVAEGLRDLIGPDQYVWCIAAGGIVAAASSWVAGLYLPGRLWFIPMKYYGPIYLVVFGAFAFSAAQKQGFSLAEAYQQAAALTETKADSGTANTDQRATGATNSERTSQNTPAARAAAPSGPPVLSWEIQDEKDQMTGTVMRKAATQYAGTEPLTALFEK